jgi:hypothetical protein
MFQKGELSIVVLRIRLVFRAVYGFEVCKTLSLFIELL